jgi:hypothetical protein
VLQDGESLIFPARLAAFSSKSKRYFNALTSISSHQGPSTPARQTAMRKESARLASAQDDEIFVQVIPSGSQPE